MSPCLSTIMATWSFIPCLSVQGKLIPYTHTPQAIVHVTLTTQTRVLDIIRDGREGTRNPTPVPVLETVKVWATAGISGMHAHQIAHQASTGPL